MIRIGWVMLVFISWATFQIQNYVHFDPNFDPKTTKDFFSNHQRLPKTFISHEKFGFLWICPEKHLLKPLKIAVFALKMTYFGHENGLSWIMLIFKLQIFLKILADNLISFQKPLYFFEKSLGLIFWNVLLTSIETIWELYRVRISSLLFAKCKGILSLCEALSQRNSKNRS